VLPDLTINFILSAMEVSRMKDIALLIAVVATFVYGYYVMKRLDDMRLEYRCLRAEGNRAANGTIRIAAETRQMLNSVKPALDHCSDIHLGIQLSVRRNSTKRLLRRLSGKRLDIALMSEETAKRLGREFTCIPVFTEKRTDSCSDQGAPIYAVYRKNILSQLRDRVLFYLETEHCRLKTGYCDYIY